MKKRERSHERPPPLSGVPAFPPPRERRFGFLASSPGRRQCPGLVLPNTRGASGEASQWGAAECWVGAGRSAAGTVSGEDGLLQGAFPAPFSATPERSAWPHWRAAGGVTAFPPRRRRRPVWPLLAHAQNTRRLPERHPPRRPHRHPRRSPCRPGQPSAGRAAFSGRAGVYPRRTLHVGAWPGKKPKPGDHPRIRASNFSPRSRLQAVANSLQCANPEPNV